MPNANGKPMMEGHTCGDILTPMASTNVDKRQVTIANTHTYKDTPPATKGEGIMGPGKKDSF